MSKTAWLWFILLLSPFVILAGCTSCVEGPPVTARGVTDAPSASGLTGYTLDVLVTEGPGGPPLAGAGVVVYYAGTSTAEWQGPRVEVRSDEVIVGPVNGTGTVESKSVVRLMTDADGHARARVPGDRIVGVVAAKDGFTEEWIPALATGDGGATGTLQLPLYHARRVVDIEGVWGPAAGSTGAVTESDYAWDPQLVPFADDADANRGYAARIVELRATLQWNNTPMGGGDLGIGLGPPSDGPRYFADTGNNIAAGAQTETAVLSLNELRDHGILGAPEVHAGAATDSAFAAPFGLPYALHIEALFDTARANLAACSFGMSADDNAGTGASVPGFELPLALAGLAGAVALAGRARRR